MNEIKTKQVETGSVLKSRDPKYLQLKADLKKKIRQGELIAGQRLPSENDLARDLGISRHTVLKSMAGLVAEGLVERKQGKGTFVSEFFRNRASESKVVALICSDREDAMVSQMIEGVSREIAIEKRELLVLNSAHDANREDEILEGLEERSVAGAILWPWQHEYKTDQIKKLCLRGFPLVLVDRNIQGIDCLSSVCTDNEAGAYEVTRHLIELGHKNIAHITFEISENSRVESVIARENGYRRALKSAGIEIDESNIYRIDQNLKKWCHEKSVLSILAYEQVHKMLMKENRPTAIFMLNDEFAISVCHAIGNHNLRIPHDMALAGFNNDPISWELPVPVTTYSQPAFEMGRKAVELLDMIIKGKAIDKSKLVLPGKLIIRQSTVGNR